MRARIVGGALAWAVSLAPLVVVNLIAYLGVFTLDEAAVIGAVALVAGVALGALTAGLIGGRVHDHSASSADEDSARAATPAQRFPTSQGTPSAALAPRAGAQGALATGGLAAALYALTMGGLILLAGRLNILPNIVTLHPIRITAAILCVAAIFLGLTMLVGWLAARGATADDLLDAATPAVAGARLGGALSGPMGGPMGMAPSAASAMQASVAAARRRTPPPLSPLSPPIRSAAARATRPLTSAEYSGPGAFNSADGYGEPGAYGANGAYARPSQAASRPGEPRYPTPASRAYDLYDQRTPYDQPDPRAEYRRRDTDDGNAGYGSRAAQDTQDTDDEDVFDGSTYERQRGARNTHDTRDQRAKRGSQRYARDSHDTDGTDDDDDADDWRPGDGQRRDSRAGARRPAHRDDRYER